LTGHRSITPDDWRIQRRLSGMSPLSLQSCLYPRLPRKRQYARPCRCD
jgi:hypothetical protein